MLDALGALSIADVGKMTAEDRTRLIGECGGVNGGNERCSMELNLDWFTDLINFYRLFTSAVMILAPFIYCLKLTICDRHFGWALQRVRVERIPATRHDQEQLAMTLWALRDPEYCKRFLKEGEFRGHLSAEVEVIEGDYVARDPY